MPPVTPGASVAVSRCGAGYSATAQYPSAIGGEAGAYPLAITLDSTSVGTGTDCQTFDPRMIPLMRPPATSETNLASGRGPASIIAAMPMPAAMVATTVNTFCMGITQKHSNPPDQQFPKRFRRKYDHASALPNFLVRIIAHTTNSEITSWMLGSNAERG